MTDTETKQEQQEAQKMQDAYFLGRYQPTEGRADRLAANLPGARSIGSTKGTNR